MAPGDSVQCRRALAQTDYVPSHHQVAQRGDAPWSHAVEMGWAADSELAQPLDAGVQEVRPTRLGSAAGERTWTMVARRDSAPRSAAMIGLVRGDSHGSATDSRRIGLRWSRSQRAESGGTWKGRRWAGLDTRGHRLMCERCHVDLNGDWNVSDEGDGSSDHGMSVGTREHSVLSYCRDIDMRRGSLSGGDARGGIRWVDSDSAGPVGKSLAWVQRRRVAEDVLNEARNGM